MIVKDLRASIIAATRRPSNPFAKRGARIVDLLDARDSVIAGLVAAITVESDADERMAE